METITLTKEQLLNIVEMEINKKLGILEKEKITDPRRFFNNVMIEDIDIAIINQQYNNLIESNMYNNLPVHLLDKHSKKLKISEVHEQIRKVTLAVFGVSLNSELTQQEYESAQKIYSKFKELYLTLYEERISNLNQKDFQL